MSLVNKPFPAKDYKFQYIEISSDPAMEGACKLPQTAAWAKFLDTHKTVVITGAPAAFSPTCSVNHIPGYVSELQQLEAKGVDQVVVLTVDSPFALQAWAKSLGVKDTKHIKFGSDAGAKLVRELGFELKVDDGVFWSGRWAAIVKDGKVVYAEKEQNPATDVTVSAVEAVLKHL